MRVVATLTTRANYHKGLRETLDSLVNQFDKVYLGLPYVSRKGEKYEDFYHPGVTIVRLEEDIGSSSKLLAGLIMEKRSKDTLIVSVDDDHTYNKNLRSHFEKERERDLKSGLTRVFTQSGIYVKYWNLGKFGTNGVGHNWDQTRDLSKNPELSTIAGVCGVAYPSDIFPETEDYINFIKQYLNDNILFRNDDVLISAYLAKLGVKRVKTRKTMENFGVENKPKGNEIISPNRAEIMEACKKLKKFFIKDKYKFYTLCDLEMYLIIILLILFIIIRRYKS